MQRIQQQLTLMQQMMLQQLALTQQTLCQQVNHIRSQQKKIKCSQMKYFWNHGTCNQWGREYQYKEHGYQNIATFQDCKGGRTKNIVK